MSEDFDENENTIIRPSLNGFLGLVSFSTRIPVTRYLTIEQMAASVILWPYLGLLVGLVAAIVCYISNHILGFSLLLTSTIVYCFLIWFGGFNHADGVMDMGDGLMSHGTKERKLEIMRDSMVGTGGIATFFIISVLTIVALSDVGANHLLATIVLVEACSKLSMITSMLYGSNDSSGIGRQIKKGMDYRVLVFDSLVLMLLGYPFLGYASVVGVIGSVVFGFYISYVAQKNFGCVTGDIMGSASEMGRLFTLICIVVALNLL